MQQVAGSGGYDLVLFVPTHTLAGPVQSNVQQAHHNLGMYRHSNTDLTQKLLLEYV